MRISYSLTPRQRPMCLRPHASNMPCEAIATEPAAVYEHGMPHKRGQQFSARPISSKSTSTSITKLLLGLTSLAASLVRVTGVHLPHARLVQRTEGSRPPPDRNITIPSGVCLVSHVEHKAAVLRQCKYAILGVSAKSREGLEWMGREFYPFQNTLAES